MHPEALTTKGQKLAARLKEFEGFYLAGGTALALQIGHRVSEDFDLFTNQEIQKDLLAMVQKVFPDTTWKVSVNNPEELTVLVNGVKITFLHYPYPVLRKFVAYQGLPMLDVLELAATKAYSIGRRGTFKDYVDLYFVLSDDLANLENIIKLGEKKYQDNFNARLFLEQLIYLEDITDTKLVFLREAKTKKEIEDFFTTTVKNFKL